MPDRTLFNAATVKFLTCFAPPAPRLRRGAGALVLFRPPRALAVSLRCSGSRHAPPAASRWSPFAASQALPASLRSAVGLAAYAPGAGTLRLRLRVCLPPRPSEPSGLLGHFFCHSRTRLCGHRRGWESGVPSSCPHLSFPRKRESRKKAIY